LLCAQISLPARAANQGNLQHRQLLWKAPPLAADVCLQPSLFALGAASLTGYRVAHARSLGSLEINAWPLSAAVQDNRRLAPPTKSAVVSPFGYGSGPDHGASSKNFKELPMKNHRIARAIDIGFGYTKLSRSAIDADYRLSSMAFPSVAASASGQMDIANGEIQRLQVVAVEVEDVRYLVGPDAMLAASGRQTRAIEDLFFDSPQYLALFLGGLAYMDLPPSVDTIHSLGMGLPLTVWRDVELRERIKVRMTGRFSVPTPNSRSIQEINVQHVQLWPQVLGALASMSREVGEAVDVARQTNLTIDVGYGTMLWLVTSGFQPHPGRSEGNKGGVSSILKAVAKSIDPSVANDPRILARIDDSLRTAKPLIINGSEVDLQRCRSTAHSQAQQHLQEMLETIGTHKDLDNIFLVGGGAHLYRPLLTTAFKGRLIREQTNEPQMANLKGYQHLVERMLAQ
jgi:plasmid segregation protein ParM